MAALAGTSFGVRPTAYRNKRVPVRRRPRVWFPGEPPAASACRSGRPSALPVPLAGAAAGPAPRAGGSDWLTTSGAATAPVPGPWFDPRSFNRAGRPPGRAQVEAMPTTPAAPIVRPAPTWRGLGRSCEPFGRRYRVGEQTPRRRRPLVTPIPRALARTENRSQKALTLNWSTCYGLGARWLTTTAAAAAAAAGARQAERPET